MLTSTVAVFWKRWVSSLRRGASGTVELSLSLSTTASNRAIVFSFLVFVLLCVTVFEWLFYSVIFGGLLHRPVLIG